MERVPAHVMGNMALFRKSGWVGVAVWGRADGHPAKRVEGLEDVYADLGATLGRKKPAQALPQMWMTFACCPTTSNGTAGASEGCTVPSRTRKKSFSMIGRWMVSDRWQEAPGSSGEMTGGCNTTRSGPRFPASE